MNALPLTPAQSKLLCNTIARLIEAEDDTIRADTPRSSLPEWDSIKHMEIILELENVFGIRFTSSEWIHCHEIADLATAIHSHLSNG